MSYCAVRAAPLHLPVYIDPARATTAAASVDLIRIPRPPRYMFSRRAGERGHAERW